MKKLIVNILSLLIILTTMYSCQSDDETTSTTIIPPIGETVNLETIIEAITANSSEGIWEMNQATLIKQNNEAINITGTYIIEDDVFTFTEEANQTINLHWKKGLDINLQAINAQEAGTDRNASSENFTLIINPDTGVITSLDNRITITYFAESGEISGLFVNENSDNILNLNLIPKNQSSFPQIPTTLSSPLELFSFDTGLNRVGFKISQSQNSLYLTNRNDLVQFQQLAFKYDLDNSTLTSIDYIQSDFATKNIEFIEGKVLSLGGAKFQALDYELTGVESFIEIDFNTLIFNGTASLDDTVYTFGNSNSSNVISKWSIGDTNTQQIATTAAPSDLIFMDGEIVDQTLYIFGGWDTDFPGSDILYTYNIDTGIQNQIQLPVAIGQAFTSTVENLIYVVGVEAFNNTQDQDRVFGVYNTLDGSFQEINTDSLNTILSSHNLEHFQVTGNKAYFVTSESLGAPNGFINRVYEATLN